MLALNAANCTVYSRKHEVRDMTDEGMRADNAKKRSPFLSTAQAAFYIGLSKRTLEKMRVTGGGPMYRKHGRYVRYHIDDLNAWSSARAKASTSHA
jgi:excisionase family DNA binding protein